MIRKFAAVMLLLATPALAGNFSISFPAARSAAPLDGRLILLLSTDKTAEPRELVDADALLKTPAMFGMNVQDAVNWPRFHHQHLPDEVRVEPGYSPDTVAILEKNGYTVRRTNAQGEVAAIAWNNGWLEGVHEQSCR